MTEQSKRTDLVMEFVLRLLKKLQLSSALDDAAQFRVIHSLAFELLAHLARLR